MDREVAEYGTLIWRKKPNLGFSYEDDERASIAWLRAAEGPKKWMPSPDVRRVYGRRSYAKPEVQARKKQTRQLRAANPEVQAREKQTRQLRAANPVVREAQRARRRELAAGVRARQQEATRKIREMQITKEVG
jgi:hypothetical protein